MIIPKPKDPFAHQTGGKTRNAFHSNNSGKVKIAFPFSLFQCIHSDNCKTLKHWLARELTEYRISFVVSK